MKKNVLKIVTVTFMLLTGSVQLLALTSYVDSDGFLCVIHPNNQSERIFPCGFYSDRPPNQPLQGFRDEVLFLAQAGFNVIEISSASLSSTDYATFFNDCDSNGIYAFVDLWENNPATFTDFIIAHKSRSCIIGWGTDDATTGRNETQMTNIENTIKNPQVDSNHIHYTCSTAGDIINYPGLIRNFACTSDGWFVQWYPITDGNTEVVKWGNNVFSATENTVNAPLASPSTKHPLSGACIQIWKSPAAGARWPTPSEVRAMTYTALACGVKSLMFYTFWDYDTNAPITCHHAELWNETASIASQLKNTLAPVILHGSATLHLSTGNEYVVASRWTYNGADYLIAVNGNANQVNVSISYNADGKTIDKLFCDDMPETPMAYDQIQHTLTKTMAAFEVQVLRIH